MAGTVVERRVAMHRHGGRLVCAVVCVALVVLPGNTALALPGNPTAQVMGGSATDPAAQDQGQMSFGELPLPRVRVVPYAGTVALTFDDGPSTSTTMRLLDVLDAANIKVTFFVTGWKVEQSPEIVREAARRGHSIQSHAYHHLPLTGMSNEAITQQVQQTSEAIFAATGVWPTCIRPPYGDSDDRVDQLLADLGYRVILWDFDSADAETQSATVVRNRVGYWRSGLDILGHDTIPLWLSVVGPAVEAMRQRGVGFSTICEPLPPHQTKFPPE